MNPVVGITTSFSDEEQRLDPRYASAVVQAGGIPVLIPLFEKRADGNALFDLIDGLIIPGGPAVTIGISGTLPEDINSPDPRRTENDSWTFEAMLERGKPIFGICYGMQFMNAYFRGSIFADVEVQRELNRTHSEKRGHSAHGFWAHEGSLMESLLGRDEIEVNSRHIQAIEAVGEGLKVGGEAPDGVIEAIESEDGTMFGVQFHPEQMGRTMLPLFRHLIRLAGDAKR